MEEGGEDPGWGSVVGLEGVLAWRLVASAKLWRVARRLVLEGRVADWRARSGRVLVSKVACMAVGFEAERTLGGEGSGPYLVEGEAGAVGVASGSSGSVDGVEVAGGDAGLQDQVPVGFGDAVAVVYHGEGSVASVGQGRGDVDAAWRRRRGRCGASSRRASSTWVMREGPRRAPSTPVRRAKPAPRSL